MPITQSHFTGMDMDTSYTLRDQKKYYKLRNGSLTIDEELGTGTVSNVNGNVYSFEIPSSVPNPSSIIKSDLPTSVSNQEIIGAGIVDDIIVLFSVDPVHVITSNPPPPPGGGQGGNRLIQPPPYKDRTIGVIWAFKYDDKTGTIIGADTTTEPGKTLLNVAGHVIFYDRLDFKFNRPIKMVGSSESPTVKKAYFTDGWNNLRYINVMDLDIKNKSHDVLELISDVVFYQPQARIVAGGVFMPGTVQYSFQMFSYGGGETVFSPVTPLVNISKESPSLSSTISFVGTERVEDGDPTDKACKFTISDFDDSFEYVRLVRIFYDTEYGIPQIDIVAESQINSSGTFHFIDDGQITLGSLTTQQFASMGGVLFSAKDLATSNNRLIAANIQETFYNPDYDARAYRYASTQSEVVDSGNPSNKYTISPTGNWQEYGSGSSSGSNWEIPMEFDSVNKDKYVFKYQKDLTTLGGTGKNVSYYFDSTSILLDYLSLIAEDGTELDRVNATRHDDGTRGHYAAGNQSRDLEDEFGPGFLRTDGYTNYANELISSQLVGYQRGETYRFGVIFYDNKGRRSFVNWIGDIKMPELYEERLTSTHYVHLKNIKSTIGYILYPVFKINNPPDEAVSYEIVRVLRDRNDKTVVASGLITPVARGMDDIAAWMPACTMLRKQFSGYNQDPQGNDQSDPNDFRMIYSAATYSWASEFGKSYDWDPGTDTIPITVSDHLFNFWSPEISFLKDIPLSGAYLYISGRALKGDSAEFASLDNDNNIYSPFALFYKNKHITPSISKYTVSIDIDDMKLVTKETIGTAIPINTGDDFNYQHFYQQSYEFSGSGKNTGNRSIKAQAGAGLIGYTTASIKDAINKLIGDFGSYDILYGSLRNDNIIIYGGGSISARKSNRYVKASMLRNIQDDIDFDADPPGAGDTHEIAVFGGDTYVTMFEYTRLYHYEQHRDLHWNWKDIRDKSMQNVVVFPVETVVNVDWRTDLSYSKETGNRNLMKEFKGSHDARGNIFDQEYDAYLLNYAYLKTNNLVRHQEEPAFFDKLVTDLSHRLMASDPKYDGEISDSWLKFKPNNILDVDGVNGEVNAIESISEHLYFFQRKGIGVTRIDERALVNDTEGISLVLGTGDIFGKPQYISSTEGTLSPFSVVKGRIGVYFYDHVNRVISAVGKNGVLDISRVKGIRSFIKNESKKVLTVGDVDGVITGFDQSTGMVYFTFSSDTDPISGDPFTIGYDENVGEFVSFYDFMPRFYISDMDRFLTIKLDGATEGWLHNIGPKGSFYNTVYDTILTTFVSEQPSITKVFDSIEYNHDADEELSKPNSPPGSNQTFSEIRAYNNYFDSGLLAINAKFRFRTWRAKIPRQNKHRASGKYLKTDLHFDNGLNKPLFLQPLLTFWRPIAFIEP